MALAPRPDPTATLSAPHTSSPDRKKGQRERGNTASQRASGRAKNGTRSGSSGDATRVARLPALDWEEIAEDVKHLRDFAAKLSHVQVGANGWATATLAIPLEYVHELVDIQQNARDGLVYFRGYYVSFSDYLTAAGVEPDEAGDGDGQSG